MRDTLEITEDCKDSLIPADRWHNPTIVDTVLDGVIHNDYRIELSGDRLRKRRSVYEKVDHV